MNSNKILWLGIDVGSTTVKIALVDPDSKKLLFSDYQRHNAKQAEKVIELLKSAHKKYPEYEFQVAVCGSGGKLISESIEAFFIQEVVANSLAIKRLYDSTRVAIELGGQDAKVIFFTSDKKTGQLIASDMRMNGSCAGGTGAFIEEIAQLLKINIEDFEDNAKKGKNIYDISGRCGVFAKTDIQPLLNQGVSKEDLALSTFHAIAKQTIGGLAQGMDISGPVIFEGGPLTFNPHLIKVFQERLHLKDDEIIIPENPEIIIAYGTALSLGTMFKNEKSKYKENKAVSLLIEYQSRLSQGNPENIDSFFKDENDKKEFHIKHKKKIFKEKKYLPGTILDVYLGLDAGSTTSKFVLINEEEELVDLFYSNNNGEPLKVVQQGLLDLFDKYKRQGVEINIKGFGTTGYGEMLFASAFFSDYHTVETVAHAEAALKYHPNTSFILDIGGQDMKAITIKDEIVTDIILNEACSAGCGSFLEAFAKNLNIPVDEIAELAFESNNSSKLGSRCTVFMNSSIITEQRLGKTPSDIVAGLCRSIIENVFTKVVRVPNLSQLGNNIVVQGGTFKNDAVLRAFEQYTDLEVKRAPFPGEMGAIGIALLTKKYIKKNNIKRSGFIGFSGLEVFSYKAAEGHNNCEFCSNNCSRTIITFNNGSSFITGNKCERGEILGDLKSSKTKEKLKAINKKINGVPDLMKERKTLIFKDYNIKNILPKNNIKIGIPRVLEYWNSAPFWKAFFNTLGFDIVFSKESTYDLFHDGLKNVPSDTVCFPAKLAHGHILDLLEKKVNCIFMPIMNRMPSENVNVNSVHVCAVVKGYPLVINESHDFTENDDIPLYKPPFHWYNKNVRNRQIIDFITKTFSLSADKVLKAIKIAEKTENEVNHNLQKKGKEVLDSLKGTNDFAVVLAGRPYHNDSLVSHDISRYFAKMGIPVLTLDSLPKIHHTELKNVRAEATINFHVRMLGSAVYSAKHPNLELVQIVSFGCGHDAILSDELIRITKEYSDKTPLVLKLDEGDAKGPLNIRIKSFVSTVRSRREKKLEYKSKKRISIPFKVKFTKEDRKYRTLLVPNVSTSFTKVISSCFRKSGYIVKPLPLSGKETRDFGKKYVHNDACFPAQINIGEMLAVLKSGRYHPENVAFALAKEDCDCRLAHYSMLARKALDEAGFEEVPIITTGEDNKDMHPGFKLNPLNEFYALCGIVMLDELENLRRRIRPYEITFGETNRIFESAIDNMTTFASLRRMYKYFKKAVTDLSNVAVYDIPRKPRVLVIGEFLLNYHPDSNYNIERYLEENDMEVVMPSLVDVFRREYLRKKTERKDYKVKFPLSDVLITDISDNVFASVSQFIHNFMKKFPYYEQRKNVYELEKHTKDFMDSTFTSGEGWLLPAEIIENASLGVNSAIIVQPFGCLPNHITGRGMIKKIKKNYPHVQILSLDYDPDTSFANIENRLQMLIINARELEKLN